MSKTVKYLCDGCRLNITHDTIYQMHRIDKHGNMYPAEEPDHFCKECTTKMFRLLGLVGDSPNAIVASDCEAGCGITLSDGPIGASDPETLGLEFK